MRYLKFMAVVGLAAGFAALSPSAHAAATTFGVGATSGALYDNSYHLGYGVSGSLGTMSRHGLSEVGIKADYLNYQRKSGNYGTDNKNEGGVALAAAVGPNLMGFEPKVGGHVGYTRFESGNFLDLGPDIMATYKLTPMLGLQAAVTPTWLINGSGNDYRTRASVGVQWTPGV